MVLLVGVLLVGVLLSDCFEGRPHQAAVEDGKPQPLL